jgi:Skp family chaperone for outer membrane proteins
LILLAQTRQVDRDKAASDQLEAHREEVAKKMQEREAALKAETDELKALLKSNTQLTQQDKELTEKIEALTREIHTRLTAA